MLGEEEEELGGGEEVGGELLMALWPMQGSEVYVHVSNESLVSCTLYMLITYIIPDYWTTSLIIHVDCVGFARSPSGLPRWIPFDEAFGPPNP